MLINYTAVNHAMEKEPPTAVILGIVNEGGKKKKEIIDYLNKHGYQTKEVMGTYDFVSYLTDLARSWVRICAN
jgi:ribose 5-phosphate isomerase RpiB